MNVFTIIGITAAVPTITMYILGRVAVRSAFAEGYWTGRGDEIDGRDVDPRAARALTPKQREMFSNLHKLRTMVRASRGDAS